MFQRWVDFLLTFFIDGFLKGFGSHVILPLELLCLGGILLGMGRALGLPLLFWHETRWKQFLAGVACVLLTAEILFVGFLVDHTRRPQADWEKAAMALRPTHSFVEDPTPLVFYYLMGGVVSLMAVGSILTIAGQVFRRVAVGPRLSSMLPKEAAAEFPGDPFWLGVNRRPLLSGAAIAALLVLVITWILTSSSSEPGNDAMKAPPDPPTHTQWLAAKFTPEKAGGIVSTEGEQRMHLLAATFFCVLAGLYGVGVLGFWGRAATLATALCTLLGLIAAVYGFMASRHVHPVLLVGGLAFLAGLGGIARYKVRLLCLKPYYDRRSRVENYPACEPDPPLLRTVDIPWTVGDSRRRPLVVVCASGGGIRAAAWTVAILNELSRAIEGFPYHVRLIAGASGGMVGSALYVSSLRSPEDARALAGAHEVQPRNGESHSDCLYRMISEDALSPVVKALVFRDLPLLFLPWPYYYRDRGRVLEETWSHNMSSAFGKKFSDLRPGEAAGWRPSLVFSPMFVEDGRRLLISNLDLSSLTHSEGDSVANRAPGTTFYSRDSYECARIFCRCWKDFPISTAARLNAAFPFVSTAAVVPTKPRRRLVDAGYFDNYGVNVAAGWLRSLLDASHEQWMKSVSGIALIQIRDGVNQLSGDKRDFSHGRASGLIARGLEDLTGPIQGLFSALNSVPLFRNDEQLDVLSGLFASRYGNDFFTMANFEFGGRASLSWYLTHQEKQGILNQARELGDLSEGNTCRTMPNLVAWWARHVQGDR